ncbi:MAG: glycosyltransferase family 1 protein [Anaerolineaceae bacterium]|nr:glycosyltransferase family 1 protein [Anaerolineaceae bacterium]
MYNDKLKVVLDGHMVGEHETGNETYIINLARSLAQQIGVSCLTAVNPRAAAGVDLGGATRIPLARNGNWERLTNGLADTCRSSQADLLHVTYIGPFLPPCPMVVTVHDVSFFRYPEFFKLRDRLLFSTLLPLTLTHASAVITISEFSKKEILYKFPFLQDRIYVTYLSPGSIFSPISDSVLDKSICIRHGIDTDFILAVGNLQPRKNLLRLIKAFSIIKTTFPSVRLVIVGKAQWHASEIYTLVSKLGLKNEVIFPGYVSDEDLVVLYNAAQVFVYPSIYEGFGLPVLEAMACGTPVVTSNSSSLPEVAGTAALMVNPKSEEEIANAILSILSNLELRNRLKNVGPAQAAKFTWEKTAMGTVEVYREVLKGLRK